MARSKLEWEQLVANTFCRKGPCADCLASWGDHNCLLADIMFSEKRDFTWDEIKGIIELHSALSNLVEGELESARGFYSENKDEKENLEMDINEKNNGERYWFRRYVYDASNPPPEQGTYLVCTGYATRGTLNNSLAWSTANYLGSDGGWEVDVGDVVICWTYLPEVPPFELMVRAPEREA